ncbi:MAG: hypothetical protein HY785_21800 [Oscillatoriophycideae cyanobacterium NC_groundwater_1537_Pr4_S-0.65um_50_18]|nr:hypothetical protein [Oscillatoriophycideae cyanobacterium NC_groundwater_1537_Pr4_S-0.65um_50_18]
MPRLVGKTSNGSAYIALLLLAAVGVAGTAEYMGVTDAVPGFGKNSVGELGEPSGTSSSALQPPQGQIFEQPNGSSVQP